MWQNLKTLLIFSCYVSICPIFSYSQVVTADQMEPYFGLPNGTIYRVIEDKRGQIWVCSENGVVKKNSDGIRRFNIELGLQTNDIWDIRLDNRERVWLSSFHSGIQYIENDTVKTLTNSDRYKQLYYSGSSGDTTFFNSNYNGRFNKRLYSVGCKEIREYKPNSKQSKVLCRTSNNVVFYQEPNQPMAIESRSNNKGVEVYDLVSLYLKTAIDNQSTYINRIGDKLVHIGKDKTSILNVEKKEFILLNDGSLIIDRKWSGIKKETKFHSKLVGYLSQTFQFTRITNLFVDSNNNSWITDASGRLYLVREVDLYTKQTTFLNKENFTIVYDIPNTNIKLGSAGMQRFYFINNHNIQPVFNNIDFDFLTDVKINDTAIFIAYGSNISVYPYIIKNNQVILKKPKNYFKGLMEFTFEKFEIASNPNEIIAETGWVTKLENGIAKRTHLFAPGIDPYLDNERITIIKQFENTFIRVSDSGVEFADSGTKKHVRYQTQGITDVQLLGDFILVSSTSKGLCVYNKSSLELTKRHEKARDILHFKQIGNKNYLVQANGVFQFRIARNGEVKVVNRLLITPTKNTIISFNKESCGDFTYILDDRILTIDNEYSLNKKKDSFSKFVVYQNGKELGVEKIKELYGNNLLFKLFQNTPVLEKSFFTHSLTGTTNSYSYSNDPFANYFSLEPGDYKYIVTELIHPLSDISLHSTTFSFRVIAPFNNSILYYFILALTFLVSISIGVYITRKVLIAKSQRELHVKKLELNFLQAQLNPHFLFNALNNLQTLVFLGSMEKVNKFIGDFSDIMRKTLDSSRMEDMSIREEVDFLESYLSLESLRFNDELTWRVVVGPNVSKETKIPSMILQPIVENAVVHAFKGKEFNLKIDIIFDIIDDFIEIQVIDNGVGIKNNIIKEQNLKTSRKSWGMKILKEKIELLNRKDKQFISLEYKSNSLDIEFPGTVVIVKIKKIKDELENGFN